MSAGTRLPFDPQRAPHDADFAADRRSAPAVAAHELSPAALRARFAAAPAWEPEIRSDARLVALDRPLRPAAVLIALEPSPDGLSVILTERTAHLYDHAGQISLPGGRIETHREADGERLERPEDAALREAHEEIGLPIASVDVLGRLPNYVTATGYDVTPVVGLMAAPAPRRLDAFEVAEAFNVPLAFLMNPAHHERRRIDVGGQSRTFYAMPYVAGRTYFIWGATAAILRNFYRFLSVDR